MNLKKENFMKTKIFYFILCCFIFHSLRSIQGDKSPEQQEKFLSIKIQQQGKLMMETFILLGKKFFLASQVVGCGVLSLYMYKKGFGKSFFIPVVCSAVVGYLCWPKKVEIAKPDDSSQQNNPNTQQEFKDTFTQHMTTDEYKKYENENEMYSFFATIFINIFSDKELSFARSFDTMLMFINASQGVKWLARMEKEKDILKKFINELKDIDTTMEKIYLNNKLNNPLFIQHKQSAINISISNILESQQDCTINKIVKFICDENANELYKQLYPYIINAIDDRDLRLFMCSKDLNEENKQVYKDLNVERGV